jgi:hypothetical protein
MLMDCIQRFLKRFTMDTIWNVAFGVDTDMQNDMDNEYFYRCEKQFEITNKRQPAKLILSKIQF